MGNPYADYDSEVAHSELACVREGGKLDTDWSCGSPDAGGSARCAVVAASRRVGPELTAPAPAESTPNLPTTLLSLPAELLLEIGFALAPHGGAKVSSFRLASVHLSKVLAPVLWAAITFSSSIHTLDPLLVAIQSDERGHNALVASVRFEVPTPHLAFPIAVLRLLRNLRRLHIIGTGRPLGTAMAEAVRGATSLERLELEHLDLTDRYDLSAWAPTVRELSVLDCQSQDDLFDNGRALIARAPLTAIDYAVPGNFPASDQSAIVMNALQAVQATAKNVVLHWEHAEDFSNIDIGGVSALSGSCEGPGRDTDARLAQPCARRAFAINLSIIGLPDLFSPADAVSHLQATHAVVKLLNWVSASPLTALSLPFQNVFQLGQAFTALRLPHLERFALVRNANPLGRNLLKQVRSLARHLWAG